MGNNCEKCKRTWDNLDREPEPIMESGKPIHSKKHSTLKNPEEDLPSQDISDTDFHLFLKNGKDRFFPGRYHSHRTEEFKVDIEALKNELKKEFMVIELNEENVPKIDHLPENDRAFSFDLSCNDSKDKHNLYEVKPGEEAKNEYEPAVKDPENGIFFFFWNKKKLKSKIIIFKL